MTTQSQTKSKEKKENLLVKTGEKKVGGGTTLPITGKNDLFLNFKFEEDFKNKTEKIKADVKDILLKYAKEEKKAKEDFEKVLKFSIEIEEINIQNRILHGERLLEVKEILKGGEEKDLNYRDGCFSAWLMKIYGNKVTPYNYMNYTSLYKKMPEDKKEKFLSMPFTAASNLARKNDPYVNRTVKVKPKVIDIIENSEGKSRDALLAEIREKFKDPKKNEKVNRAGTFISLLKKVLVFKKAEYIKLTKNQMVEFEDFIEELEKFKAEIL